jgi:hypothetical protein
MTSTGPDLLGKRFGNRLVLHKDRPNYWLCRCDCGTESVVQTDSLLRGVALHCVGCRSEARKLDLYNRKFTNLTPLRHEKTRAGEYEWVCQCDCGNYVSVRGYDLLSGRRKACARNGSCCGPRRRGRGYLFDLFKKNAILRNLPFELTLEELVSICEQPCYICGKLPSQIVGGYKGNFVYNGIDRIDNLKGYIPTNCAACCGVCNHMKCATSLVEFKLHVERIYRHLFNKG